jgi:hypothetical protein
MSYICTTCGCTGSQAVADAMTLSLQKELQNGAYKCCQIAAWADEQWLAWMQAAEEDGQPADGTAKPLEYLDTEAVFVPVRIKNRYEPRWENSPLWPE